MAVETDEDLSLQHNVTRVVRLLLGFHGLPQRALMPVLGVGEGAISKKMQGRWTLEDVELLARYFKRSVSFFLESADALFGDPRNASCLSSLDPWPSLLLPDGSPAYDFTRSVAGFRPIIDAHAA